MMSNSGRNRYPFTASQWQELEHQALVFKYMISGMSVPPDLLFTIRRSLDSSLSSKYLIHQPQHIGWNGFHMGFGRKIDPEPGRCRRTDGKKWRCSKEAYTDSKYCERHMHRGRNRSRKPVEILSAKAGAGATTSPPTNAIPITTTTTNTTSSVTKSTHLSSSHSSPTPNYESQFLYPHFSNSTRPHENTTNFFLEPNAYSHAPGKDYRDISDGSSVNDSTWQLAPLTMGSSLSQMKQNTYSSGFSNLNDNNMSFKQQKHGHGHHHYYDVSLNIESEDNQPKKVMHHFLDDQWPPKDKGTSWINSDDNRTQLSISTPSSLHDFFMTQKW